MKKIILASGSKQRKKLLEMTGIDFEVRKSNYMEDMTEKMPATELAKKLALGKALDVARNYKDAIIIGADSFGILDGRFLGKPRTPEEAQRMLRELSGKKHEVITGIALIDIKNNKTITDYDIGTIWIKDLTDEEIELYIKTGEPMDKAPSYTIEGIGSTLVEKIEGNYSSIIGLPLYKIYKHLLSMGINLLKHP